MTRAEALRHALAFALSKVHVGPKRLKLGEDTRWQVAGEAIDELRKHGGWKELDEEAPIKVAQAGGDGDQARGVEGEAGVEARSSSVRRAMTSHRMGASSP
jgi:hypothetical protein